MNFPTCESCKYYEYIYWGFAPPLDKECKNSKVLKYSNGFYEDGTEEFTPPEDFGCVFHEANHYQRELTNDINV